MWLHHHSVIWFICYVFLQTINGETCKRDYRCRISKVYGMKAADCYKKDIREFPQCISTDMEIIDLSMNRLRKVSLSDVRRYTYLKMLYLSDNLIMTFENGIVDHLADLQTLDVSMNALSKVPPTIFHLPLLKSLYLGHNNMNIAEIIEEAKPIKSPLIQFDLSYIMTEEPDVLPILGVLPYLRKYNISGNKITDLSVKHFAGLCSLQILDTQNTSVDFQNVCECWRINRWLVERQVKFSPFSCDNNNILTTNNINNACREEILKEDLITFEKCKEVVEATILKTRLRKILIPISIVGITAVIILLCFVIRKKRRRL